jgi:hypothetical protein
VTADVTPLRYRSGSGASPPDRLGPLGGAPSAVVSDRGGSSASRENGGQAVGKARRINVTVPVDLDEQLRERFPTVAYSALLQQAMRDALACQHPSLQCLVCGDAVDPSSVASAALNRFFADLGVQLEEAAYRGGSVVGFARVVRRLGLEHLVPAARYWAPPRLTRAERERQRDDQWKATA